MWVPPNIAPAAHTSADIKTLKAALKCTIATWPDAVYTDDFYRPPAPGILFVMHPDAVQQVLSDPDTFDQGPIMRRLLRPIWRSGLAIAQGREWRWQRRALAPVFTPKMSDHVVPLAAASANRMAKDWEIGRSIEITAPIANAVNDVVFDSFLAGTATPRDRAAFASGGDALTKSMDRINVADLFGWPDCLRPLVGKTSRRSARHLHKLVQGVFSRQSKDTRQTLLLDHLRTAKDPETGQTMSDETVRDSIVGMLAAGRETTALAISWALWLVACDKKVQAKLATERQAACGTGPVEASHLPDLSLHRQVILEALRLFPPAPQMARHCIKDTTLLGQDVAKGTTIVLPIYALHRRADFWADPNSFDPHRFAPDAFDMRAARGHFLPFGGGGRICIGMAFAVAEAQTMLATVLSRFEISADRDTKIDFRVGATLRSNDGLHITVALR